MDVISLPFNAHVGLARSETKGCLLELAPRAEHLNHLGTVHAGALYALAEATSGEFLVQARGDREAIGGVVRRAEVKYSRPAEGDRLLVSRVTTSLEVMEDAFSKIETRGRALVDIGVELRSGEETLASFTFTWWLTSDAGVAGS